MATARPKIAIVDYGMGNLYSVVRAFEFNSIETVVTSDPEFIVNCDAVILPGVGAFGDAIQTLNTQGLSAAIKETVKVGKPFLGICLGLQLLFTKSEEFGTHNGLGLLDGVVKKFSIETGMNRDFKVPQISWNRIVLPSSIPGMSPIKPISESSYYWFVHSYYVLPDDEKVVLTTTEYGGVNYCSSLIKDNMVGFQFHPEKSGKPGLAMLANWYALNFKKG